MVSYFSKIMNNEFLTFIVKTSTAYGILAFSFSLIGILLPYSSSLGDPLSSATVEHIVGHIVWGMIAGIAAFSLRYFFLTGIFAIVLDFDHIIQFFGIEAVPRMGHSLPFALLSLILMMLIFNKKDYRLGAVSFAAVFSHMSFDTLINAGKFPIFVPFFQESVKFQNIDWVYLQLIAVIAILVATLFEKRNKNYKILN